MQSNSLSKPRSVNQTVNQILISSRVVGVLVLIFVEMMLFSALLSSFFVMKKGREIWDAAGSIHLPVLATGFNTLVLLASGVSLFFAGKALKTHQDIKLASLHLFRAIALSCFFLAFQIYLGVQLINSGLTISSSVFGGCFHLMVGMHLLQALMGTLFMVKLYRNINTTNTVDSTMKDHFNSLQIFWLFVMGI